MKYKRPKVGDKVSSRRMIQLRGYENPERLEFRLDDRRKRMEEMYNVTLAPLERATSQDELHTYTIQFWTVTSVGKEWYSRGWYDI